MRMNFVIFDENQIELKNSCNYIEELVKKYRLNAKVIGFLNGYKLLEFMECNEITMAFLDITQKSSKELNGITISAKLMKKHPKLITIFISQQKEYAYDAFVLDAFSYFLKPVDPERLERIFKRAILHLNDISNRMHKVPLIITENNIKRKINQSNILYIERVGSQSIIVTKLENHSVYETIISLAVRLEDNFLQINQGIIVNLDEVVLIQGYQVIMKTGEIFSVGRTYSKEVKKRYLEYPRM